MKKHVSIRNQLLIPITFVIGIMAISILAVVGIVSYNAFQKQMLQDNLAINGLVAENVSAFLSESYALSEELANDPDILTMDTDIQTPILEACVSRNDYLELLYIQDSTGMQTGRSSGELADRSNRWWFQQMLTDQKPFVSKSYFSVNTGMPCASVFIPMYHNGEFTGVFATDIKLDSLVDMAVNYSDDNKNKIVFIIDGEGNVVAHPNKTYIEELYNYSTYTKTVSVKDSSGNPVTDSDGNIKTSEEELKESDSFKKMIAKVMSQESGNTIVKIDDGKYYASYSPIKLDGESDAWSAITLQKRSTLLMPVYIMLGITIFISVVVLLIAMLIVNMITKRITNPIIDITSIIGTASEGDFSVKADTHNDTEVGELAESFNVLTDKVSKVLTETVGLLKNVQGSARHLEDISQDSETVVEDVYKISEGAIQQSEKTQQVVTLTDELKKCNEKLHEISSQLIEGVRDTSNLSIEGLKDVEEMKQKGEISLNAVQSSYKKVISLNESSQKIGAIVQEINDISDETSLLALNASIEAARAGEQGRGFAVVAEQVSSLAQDSADATKNIEEIVNALQSQIQDTVNEMDEIKNRFQDQITAMNAVEASFEQFKNSSKESLGIVERVASLIETADSVNSEVVVSIDDICDISKQTESHAKEVASHMKEQTDAIRDMTVMVNNMNAASQMIENEMSKFTLESNTPQ